MKDQVRSSDFVINVTVNLCSSKVWKDKIWLILYKDHLVYGKRTKWDIGERIGR